MKNAQTLSSSTRHPELAPEFCLPLPHSFVATGEGSAPLLFRAAYRPTSDQRSTAKICVAILCSPVDYGNTKNVLSGKHSILPLPPPHSSHLIPEWRRLHPRSLRDGHPSPTALTPMARFYYLINRAMLHPSAFLGENKARRRTLNQLLPRLFIFASHLPSAASCAHLDKHLVR